ncbi:hypothetical protein [Streptacidiphilus anmyonensis]|uniref:hypothetical protein n=1 Tax=Streptacidiphilus anmyonensis TaxID=405782 RepID=UPI0005A72F19|nr:hypothetical protein [Streptacidiphilus anmyonensis]
MTLAAIDALLAQPFPQAAAKDGSSGPGHLVLTLRQSREFWDDVDDAASSAAYAEFEAELAALAATLTARWGEPGAVDLLPFLRAGLEGEHVPEPLDLLSQYVGRMQVWTPRGGTRWLALAVGQWDKELPVELVAAVGTVELRP